MTNPIDFDAFVAEMRKANEPIADYIAKLKQENERLKRENDELQKALDDEWGH